jgi:uncharacterized protein YdiU (UPF0061 family)
MTTQTAVQPAAGGFRFDNSFARELPTAYVAWRPALAPQPRLRFLNHRLADELGLDAQALEGEVGAAIFSGNALPEGAKPVAQAYAGHQFGGFSPQLGDGRALLLGELVDRHGRRRDLAFKGSGPTPFSRGGDGKAAIGPMLREVLIGEAMHALGVPTTRALAVVATGERVRRDRFLPGAVLTRVAASHLRVGTFQFFAARDDEPSLRALLAHAIARHDPALRDAANPALALLEAVAGRQAALIAQWMNVGFIHGVMNTDNMTISGETIDYGPCAFLEAYDPAAVFSSIDHQGRYAFGNQPRIALWNLARLAESLLPLIEAETERAVALATGVLDAFPARLRANLLAGRRVKLGIAHPAPDDDTDDERLIDDWLSLLQAGSIDFTLAWRRLADAALGNEGPLRALFDDSQAATLTGWLERWRARCEADDRRASTSVPIAQGDAAPGAVRAAAMRRANPRVIPRNHRVEEALAAATEHDDLGPFDRLLAAVRNPYGEEPLAQPYDEPADPGITAAYRTFCGT